MICLLLALSLNTFAQNQSFTFTINSKDYTTTEQRVNDLFGSGFQEMVANRVAKSSDFDLWKSSFDRWKELALVGRYKWTTYANRVGDQNYTGEASKEDLGLGEDGKLAKGNMNKKPNKGARMAYLNGLMMRYITNYLTEYRIGL